MVKSAYFFVVIRTTKNVIPAIATIKRNHGKGPGDPWLMALIPCGKAEIAFCIKTYNAKRQLKMRILQSNQPG